MRKQKYVEMNRKIQKIYFSNNYCDIVGTSHLNRIILLNKNIT